MPLVENRLLFLFLRYGQAVFAAFLLVFVRFRQRKIAPYASIGAKQVFI